MTDQQPHTPTAAQIREDYAHLRYHFADGWSIGEERVQFDNWLTAELAAAEQRGAIKALRDVEGSLIDWEVIYGHEQGTAEDHESIRIAAWIGRRADQMGVTNE